MITLGIETSCDETALCLLETRKNGEDFEYRILGNIVNSQINLHRKYGGVFPMLAKREHIKNLPILYKKILEESGISEKSIDSISVTRGPGLEPALWTGILFAKELGKRLGVKVIPTNHMEGHIVASLLSQSDSHTDFQSLKKIEYPALAVLMSGGHTEIVKIEKFEKYEVLGRTLDDAVGEAFDKVARMLGLPYPGGPEISRLAEKSRLAENIPLSEKSQLTEKSFKLPRPMIHSKDLNFSFSGLKTSVLYLLKEIKVIGEVTKFQKEEIAREFEDSVTEVLVSKIRRAIEENETKSLIIGGGVTANTHIRHAFEILAEKLSIPLYLPVSGLSGDNALMIALVGAIKPSPADDADEDFIVDFKADGNLKL